MLLAGLFMTANLYALGMLFELAMEPHGIRLSKFEIFGLSALTRFSKQVSPDYIAATIRAVYLKKKYKSSYTRFASSFALSNLMQLTISGPIAILALITHKQNINSTVLIVLCLLVVAITFIIFGPLVSLFSNFVTKTPLVKVRLVNKANEALAHFDELRTQKVLLIRMTIWIFATLVISALMLKSIFFSLGQTIGVDSALFMSSMLSWSMVFSVTPGGIGVREGMLTLAGSVIGIPIAISLAAALSIRVLMFVITALLSAYFAPRLFNESFLSIHEIKSK